MSKFVTTNFSDGNDISLELAFEEWVRPLVIGSAWTHIRIGILWQLTATASTPGSGASGFAIGVCSGTAHPFGDSACTNFAGVYCNTALNYVANAGNPYMQFLTGSILPCKKIGSSITTYTDLADGVGMAMATTGGTARRSGCYIDIIKASPNYTVGVMLPTSANIATDFTIPFLKSGMTIALPSSGTATTIGGVAFVPEQNTVLATSESSGSFDTIDIYSNFLNNPLEIQEVLIEKLS